ncbi:hypothetical protein BHM03_00034653 [Ensete ventricosum]|nr:hypothetical protein BHM03_00034653 [Ensete ventricosum]
MIWDRIAPSYPKRLVAGEQRSHASLAITAGGATKLRPEDLSLDCRPRWSNCLCPDVGRGGFKEDEEDLIIKLHALLGNRYAFSGRLPGRSGDEVKNYWNSHLRKKLRSMGVDPDNHRVTQNVLLRRSQSSHSATLSSTDDATNERVECCWCFNPATEGHRACYADGRPEENCNGGLPDLNLDLTISLPSSLVEKRRGSEDSTDPARLDNPTLLLFP